MIIGFAAVLLVLVAVVVDASAAYLQRQGLTTIADGAALQGADLGSVSAYTDGIPEGRLSQSAEQVHAAVGEHLAAVGAYDTYPGLTHGVDVDAAAGVVTVTLRAPLDLPLAVPGVEDDPVIVARGRAAVTVQR
ncbi:hypothetical protein FC770_10660 [Nocardioides jishulii]|uniref:Putative Flp pilus-assembly TadG-like N-terminal domain-containing protein n=2 Tax=Nocardioides jishulii TaxID=2575440 RepID=A0A4U2YMN1_9ACTN|nr:hypothetical protein FCL41_04025 [Nocardioides jishulii]TKI61832.1 hypothetical protein FC770_10660 [Nocardioides jishulii]